MNINPKNLTPTAQLIIEVYQEAGYDAAYIHNKADRLRGMTERQVFSFALTSLDSTNLEKLKYKL
ncbi:hypothetical protein PSYCG_00165 (plasmid) [Psychrobacter sp. G]|jgi:hypothetical protein|uniref:hypothetical protein n=1 Tax=Psychrobacter sp. G TaxID=571800 RepID=UPI000354DFAC|nr:hypothetical protein [Psychrobacter sp. G]AGP50157.1 hypothetical protein PSYCG_00165 [Psychrobacter sp. G]